MKINHPTRIRLERSRPSITHKREVCGYECYFIVSFFDGHKDDLLKPAEIFVKVAKHGTIISGLLDGLCVTISVALQYGVPWESLRSKLEHHNFESKGDENHASLLDGIVKAMDHLIAQRREMIGEDVQSTNASSPRVSPA